RRPGPLSAARHAGEVHPGQLAAAAVVAIRQTRSGPGNLLRWCQAANPRSARRHSIRPPAMGTSHSRSRPEEVGLRMRPYEVMVIFDPDTEERSVQPTLEQYLTVITKGG